MTVRIDRVGKENRISYFFYLIVVILTWYHVASNPARNRWENDQFGGVKNAIEIHQGLSEAEEEQGEEVVVAAAEEKDSGEEEEKLENNLAESLPIAAKCCNLGFAFTFENKSHCIETENEFLPDFEDRPEYSERAIGLPAIARYQYYIGDPCFDGKYVLDAETYSYDKYSIYSNGTLFYLDELYSKEEFCLESVNDTLKVFICFGAGGIEPQNEFVYTLYAIGLLISVPFLIATAVIYISIDLLRDLRGKSLSCYVLCLATAYIFLALVQLASYELNEDVCIASGFIIQFFFVAAFFWLTIICFDTWRCIKNDFICLYKPINLSSEKTTFCYYFICGFYGPVILSIVSLIMDLEPGIPETYSKPRFGIQSCWFYSHEAAFQYFYGPIGVTICVNFLFFILSTRKIYQIHKKKAEILYLNRSPANGHQEKPHSIKIYIKT